MIHVRNKYELDGTKTETLTGHYSGFRLKWQSFTVDAPFLPNSLTARLVKHVEEHGESIVKPDLTGLHEMYNFIYFSGFLVLSNE